MTQEKMKWVSIRGHDRELQTQGPVTQYFNVARIKGIEGDTVRFVDDQAVQVSKHAAGILQGAVRNYEAQKAGLPSVDKAMTLTGQSITPEPKEIHPKDLNLIVAYFEAENPYWTAENKQGRILSQPQSPVNEKAMDRVLQFRMG